MPKNIVLCLDGTADFAARHPTHVFRLFKALERSDSQVIYYDGGVGTLRDARELSWIGKRVGQALDLAAGFSIREHFLEAYEFLCKRYQDGDRIFLFGFSRGAYTARVLAGAIDKFGIPYPEHLNILPYMWQALSEVKKVDEETSRFYNRLKGAFGRSARVHFIGIWDTVSAFGIGRLRTIPQTSKLDAAEIVRHAVSIDERRNMFPENLVSAGHKNLQEVWFAGVHRDVGGGGAEGKLGLSMCAFTWILEEAERELLLIDKNRRGKMLDTAPDPLGPANASFWMTAAYAPAGLIPMRAWSTPKGRYAWTWLRFWRTRPLPDGALVHRFVKERMDDPAGRYRPRNVDPARVTWYG